MSEKLPIKHNRSSLIGRVMCPMLSIVVCDTQCAKCRYCRIVEYDYVKCSYAQDIKKAAMTYYTSI